MELWLNYRGVLEIYDTLGGGKGELLLDGIYALVATMDYALFLYGFRDVSDQC